MCPIECLFACEKCQVQFNYDRMNLRGELHTNAPQGCRAFLVFFLLLSQAVPGFKCFSSREQKNGQKNLTLTIYLYLYRNWLQCPHCTLLVPHSNRAAVAVATTAALRGVQEGRQLVALYQTLQAEAEHRQQQIRFGKDYLCADIPKLIRLWIIPGYRFWRDQIRPWTGGDVIERKGFLPRLSW